MEGGNARYNWFHVSIGSLVVWQIVLISILIMVCLSFCFAVFSLPNLNIIFFFYREKKIMARLLLTIGILV